MPKYVAFLRAINVGSHLVKMDHLRSLFEALGFTNCETFIASGNVVFDTKSKDTKALEQKIEKHLQNALGYEVVTFVRTLPEVAAVATYKPFTSAKLKGDGANLHVGFIKSGPDASTKRKFIALSGEDDSFNVNGSEVYWLRYGGFSDSKFSGAMLEKALGQSATFRNINTVRRIAAKYDIKVSTKE